MNDDIEPTIWQPANPNPGWTQAAEDSELTIFLPLEENLVVPMFFRRIPAGEFRMGSRGKGEDEEPAHRVVIPEDFYMATFPVTQVQYRAMAQAFATELAAVEGNKGTDPSNDKGDLRPVEQVSWDDAVALGKALSKADCFRKSLGTAGLSADAWEAGLPNEAMWEYACRAGTDTEYGSGDGEAALAEVGWYKENAGTETHPVGEFPTRHPWHLHDMHGNVWEWCADVYDPKAYRKRAANWNAATWGETDAADDAEYWSDEDRKAEKNRNRVLRGGSWNNSARGCRSAYRNRLGPDGRVRNCGFRLCVFPGPGNGRQAESASGGKARRDDAAVPEVADAAARLDLSKETLSAAKRPRKK